VRWPAAALAAALGSVAAAETVDLRGGEASIEVRAAEFRPEGLLVETAEGRRTLAWDRVRDVRGRELTAGERQRLEVAERLWRGRSRLARGDTELARSAFESVAAAFLAAPVPPSESGLIAAEGLLRTRLAAGDATGAIVASLEAARIRAAGVRTDRFAALPPVVDDATGIAPALAPAFAIDPLDVRSAEAARLVAEEIAAWIAARPDLEPGLRDLARGWEAALRGESPKPAAAAAPAVRLVNAAARLAAADAAGSDPELLAAREGLEAAVAAMPESAAGWSAAWRAYLFGRSLARGRDPSLRREGIVRLLSIPARRTAETDLLSRIALAEAIRSLRGLGEVDAADRLERELLAGLPNSPPPATRAVPSS
jgi:hypothetical protein